MTRGPVFSESVQLSEGARAGPAGRARDSVGVSRATGTPRATSGSYSGESGSYSGQRELRKPAFIHLLPAFMHLSRVDAAPLPLCAYRRDGAVTCCHGVLSLDQSGCGPSVSLRAGTVS